MILQTHLPALEHGPEFLIQRFDPRLQEQMRTALGPLPLLLLAEAPADDLVDRGLYEAGADALARVGFFAQVVPFTTQTRLTFDVVLPLWGHRGPRPIPAVHVHQSRRSARERQRA